LKICTEINSELAQPQKLIVLYQLLEFVNSDGGEISEQEMEFINTVAETFNFPGEEYASIKDFVLFPFEKLPVGSRVLVIDSNKEFSHPEVKHIYSEGLHGQVRV